MNQQEYISSLKNALASMPYEQSKNAITEYEQRFAEGLAAGRSEEEIAKELDDPKKIVAKMKTQATVNAFSEKKTFANFGRMFVSFIGLAFFNLFMLIPASIYMAFLMSAYAVAFAFFVGGSALTASGIAGVDAIHFENSDNFSFVQNSPEHKPVSVKVDVDKDGIRTSDNPESHLVNLFVNGESSSARAMQGIGLSLAGILLFLLSLVISKYSMMAIKRYAMFNWNILRNA